MRLPNGSTLEISSAFDASINVTAITNADPAVASATNTLTAGDVVLLTSGWEPANNRAFRVASPSGTSFALEGLDSTNTTDYPAGYGDGSALAVSTWEQIPDVINIQYSGGDWGTYQWQTLASRLQKQMPTVKNASKIDIVIEDNPSSPIYQVLKSAESSQQLQVLRINFKGGGQALYPCYVGFNENPTLHQNQGMTVAVTLLLVADLVRYTA